jgi:hypothetical protein
MESPVPFMAADVGWRDAAWLVSPETRLAVPWGGGGLVLTVTVPPAPATVGGGNLPTGFRLQQNIRRVSWDSTDVGYDAVQQFLPDYTKSHHTGQCSSQSQLSGLQTRHVHCLGFEVLTPVVTKNAIFWDITPCSQSTFRRNISRPSTESKNKPSKKPT